MRSHDAVSINTSCQQRQANPARRKGYRRNRKQQEATSAQEAVAKGGSGLLIETELFFIPPISRADYQTTTSSMLLKFLVV